MSSKSEALKTLRELTTMVRAGNAVIGPLHQPEDARPVELVGGAALPEGYRLAYLGGAGLLVMTLPETASQQDFDDAYAFIESVVGRHKKENPHG